MCQCPRRALLISTDLGITFGFRWIIVCQCPRRALLISTKEHNTMIKLAAIGVSMPSAGSSHFYANRSHAVHRRDGGVNALGGLFSFLLGCRAPESRFGRMCQCPRRAILISTWNIMSATLPIACVNALGGLFSFLQPLELLFFVCAL